MALVLQTLRALAAPRRAVPLAAVGVAMLSAEWLATHAPSAMAIDRTLLLAFCLIGPASWRLFSRISECGDEAREHAERHVFVILRDVHGD